MKKHLIIYGVGKFAEYAAYIFENESNYSLKSFCIEKEYLSSSELPENYNHLELLEFESIGKQEDYFLFIAVGNNEIRTKIFNLAIDMEFNFASFISPKAITYENLEAGRNVFVSEGSIIHPFVKIGDNTIIISSRIGHHSLIQSNCLLSGSTLAGNVQIGENCYLGVNSSISQNLRIKNKNIIGMNVSIEKDTDPGAVFSHKGTVKRKIEYDKVANRFLK